MSDASGYAEFFLRFVFVFPYADAIADSLNLPYPNTVDSLTYTWNVVNRIKPLFVRRRPALPTTAWPAQGSRGVCRGGGGKGLGRTPRGVHCKPLVRGYSLVGDEENRSET